MADRKVRYILEVDYAGEGVTARAADDLREVDDAAREASDGLEQAGGGFSKVQASIVTMQSALGIAEQGFAAIQQAAQFAYETLSEGAALVDARDDFDDLAASIGTTADALEGDLSAAAGGLITDAELIGQAGELMALGLGLSADEITQLTGLAAELDWNFKSLTDTLNTGSSRGLKELGLNIADVKQKAEALAEAGMATDEAFRWAIIEAGGEKLERVGRKSEETAGQIQQLEVMVANVQDEFDRGAAEGFAAALGVIAENAPAAGEALEAAGRGASYFGAQILAYAGFTLFGSTLELMIEKGKELEEQEQRNIRLQEFMAISAQKDADMYGGLGDAVENLAAQWEMSAGAADWALASQAGMVEAYEAQAAWAAMAGENAYYLAGALESQAEAAERAEAAVGAAAEVQAAWVAYTSEMEAQGGDQFTQMWQSGEAWDFAEAVYGAADAAGAGAGPLSELAVALGLVDEATAAAALDATAQQALAESIAGAAVAGKVMWEDYIATVERAQRVMSGEEVINMFPGPVSQIGPRAQLPEEDLIAMGENMPSFEVEITADTQAVIDAVETATGVVNGFAELDPQVKLFIDTADFNIGLEAAKTLLSDLPESKTVVVNFVATGDLEELRAMGSLP